MTIRRLFIHFTITVASIAASLNIHTMAKNTSDGRRIVRPDLETIKSETTDPTSSRYYPKLMQSYLSNDTTLTAEDFRFLYYGYLFQEDYEPYRHVYNAARLKEIEPLYSKASHSRAECQSILQFS
ncbi:MAG: DUF4919 domain-containing protein, partial [Muribaculaceae bacterium]|nr:DUF4919 domain-containing protein [Muribaculaceae bacterium]